MRTAAAVRLLAEARGHLVSRAIRPPAAQEAGGGTDHRAHDTDGGVAHTASYAAHGASYVLEIALIRVRHGKLLQLMHDYPELHRLGLSIAIETGDGLT